MLFRSDSPEGSSRGLAFLAPHGHPRTRPHTLARRAGFGPKRARRWARIATARPTPRTQNEISSLDLATLLIEKGAPVNAKLTAPARRPLGGGGAAIAGRGATPFLRAAAAAGATTVGGLMMLIHQGAEAFRLWTGLEPPVDVMFEAARAALAERAQAERR